MAVESGLNECFPSDMKSFDGYEAYFDDLATQCGGAKTGGALIEMTRRNTGESERWVVIFRLQDDPRLLGYGDPFVYVITGFSRVDE